jgi:coenzyme F420-0:L-glutamate ligase/coenzyme F420-1:gamma-L-glutamate ligase
VLRGLGAFVTADDGPGAAGCVRVGPTDWFAYGQVEAVRAALGVAPGEVEPPPLDPDGEPLADRVARAVRVAGAGPAAPRGVLLAIDGASVRVDGAPVAAGRAAERVRAALWAEGVAADVVESDGAVRVVPAPAGGRGQAD